MKVINEIAVNMVRRGEFSDTAAEADKTASGPQYVVNIMPTAGPSD
jgi:hypothetical protein